MVLLHAAVRRESVTLLGLFFLWHVQDFSMRFRFLTVRNVQTVVFLPIFDYYFCVVCIVFSRSNHSSFAVFYVVFEMSFWCIDTIFNADEASSSLFFLIRVVCLYYLSNVKLYASSWVFVFSVPFVKVLPSFTLRIVSSILRVEKLRCLSLRWDFCYIVWFRIVFRPPMVFSSPLDW